MSDLEFLMYEDFILGAISAEEYAEFLKNKEPETLLAQAF